MNTSAQQRGICYSRCLITNRQTLMSAIEIKSSSFHTKRDIFGYFKWSSSCTVWFSVSTEVSIKCLCCRLKSKPAWMQSLQIYGAGASQSPFMYIFVWVVFLVLLTCMLYYLLRKMFLTCLTFSDSMWLLSETKMVLYRELTMWLFYCCTIR